MTAALRMDKRLTEDEYFAFEARAELRHEYFDGLVFAMVGGRDYHNLIAGEFFMVLGAHVALPCQVFQQTMKLRVKIDRSVRHLYPDVMVSCGPDDRQRFFREKPSFLAEVVSNSTEKSDRTDRALLYRTIPSLVEHAIVFQDVPKVELFRRRTSWTVETYLLADTFRLDSVDLDVSVARLYRHVFP